MRKLGTKSFYLDTIETSFGNSNSKKKNNYVKAIVNQPF